MRLYLFLILLSALLPAGVRAQQFRGRAYDAASTAPLGSALVTNTHSGALWVSDSAGNFAFTAYPGDIVTIQHPAYQMRRVTITSYNDLVSVGMERAPVQLAEVQVLSPMLRYKLDSAFHHEYYRKALGYAKSKPQMDYSGGIGTSGLFSELALAVSGKKKAYKRFADELSFLEEMRFSSIRYTPNLVMAQTGLDDSAANVFINRHPIEKDFVRTASELELKMWVREQYRAEHKGDKVPPLPRPSSGVAEAITQGRPQPAADSLLR